MKVFWGVVVWLAVLGGQSVWAAEMTALRAWRAPDNTRLVFDLSAQVPYRISPDSSPARLIVDMDTVQTPAGFVLPTVQAPLKSLRLEKHGQGQRLVIETTVELVPKIFQLPPNEKYGHRLVLDLYDKYASSTPAPQSGAGAAMVSVTVPAAAPTTLPVDKKTAPPAEKMGNKASTAMPSDLRADKPSEKIIDKLADKTTDKTTDKTNERITEKALEKPLEQPAEKPLASAFPAPPAEPQKTPAEVVSEKPDKKRYRNIVVAIDPGHGGEDPGAVGLQGTHEKHITLAIARELEAQLRAEPGITPVLTRTGDYFLPLQERRRIARFKEKADIFVSVHADAAENRAAKGASVFALSVKGAGTATSRFARMLAERENRSDLIGGAALEKGDNVLRNVLADMVVAGSLDHSLHMGKNILGGLMLLGPLHSKRVEQAGFAVLKEPGMVSLLVETGFISNPGEEIKLNNKEYQRSLARVIAAGIRRYCAQYPAPGTYFSWAADKKNNTEKPAKPPVAASFKNESIQSVIAGKEYAASDVLKNEGFLQGAASNVANDNGLKNAGANKEVLIGKESAIHKELANKEPVNKEAAPHKNPNNSGAESAVGKNTAIKISGVDKKTAPQKSRQHRVKRGENLTLLAEKYGVSQAALRAENKLKTDQINLGQVIKIPAEKP